MRKSVRCHQVYPYNIRLVLAIFLLGLVSGLVGIFLHYLLEIIEKLVFGHSEHDVAFLTNGVSPLRMTIDLLLIGLVSALIWFVLQRKIKLLSIKGQMKEGDQFLESKGRFIKQLLHSVWQIVVVGGGAPVGKEGAPLEIGALLGRPIANYFGLTASDRLFMIASGAGAGLAAVYQVPLTSVFFVFETLGLVFSIKRFVLLGMATYVAAFTARLVISSKPLYHVSAISWSMHLVWVLPVVVVIITPMAYLFSCLTKKAINYRIKDQKIFFSLPLTFIFIAILANFLPHLLGNGRMMAQEILNGTSIRSAVILFILKSLLVFLTLWAGAYGGTLTPSFALGICGGFVLAMVMGIEGNNAMMLLGAVCFLAVSLRAPLSAAGLVFAFTGQDLVSMPYLLVTALLAYRLSQALDLISWNRLMGRKLVKPESR